VNLTGLHFLLTYRCTSECDHCFVWGSPNQTGVFTLAAVEDALDQARDLGTIEWIFFEGGEPFLFHPVLVRGVQAAAARGFRVGVVTNGYWATTTADARAWLEPLSGQLHSLSVSTDELHYEERVSPEARNVLEACQALGIPADMIICELPARVGSEPRHGEPVEGGAIMYRGRAAVKLAAQAPTAAWDTFDECPHEDLEEPGRVHLDPLGNLHLCQGLLLGNLFTQPLKEIVHGYRPTQHPIVGPLLQGGPAELVRRYDADHRQAYADACHLCYETRLALRPQFGRVLGPGQMYGEGLA
jgi:Radical SAM superfamily